MVRLHCSDVLVQMFLRNVGLFQGPTEAGEAGVGHREAGKPVWLGGFECQGSSPSRKNCFRLSPPTILVDSKPCMTLTCCLKAACDGEVGWSCPFT